jgi:hypothetical protein
MGSRKKAAAAARYGGDAGRTSWRGRATTDLKVGMRSAVDLSLPPTLWADCHLFQ